MILVSQKSIFDKQGLGFKSSKNQKYFKNYFVKESTITSPSTTCKFYGKRWHISSTCPLRNGFESFNFPNHVFKLKNTLYSLKQALEAWYERLTKFFLENGFKIGKIDTTLFIKTKENDILLVQIYVDDIIFGATKCLSLWRIF